MNPIVGIVFTTSPNFNFNKIVVLPAASNPNKSILSSYLSNNDCHTLEKKSPI